MSEDLDRKIFELEKFDLKTQHDVDLLKQRVDQVKDGLDHSRATGFNASKDVALVREQLAKEVGRLDALTKDVDNCFEKIKRVEKDLTEKAKAAQDTADETRGDFKDINKSVFWGILGSLVVLGIAALATYLFSGKFGG